MSPMPAGILVFSLSIGAYSSEILQGRDSLHTKRTVGGGYVSGDELSSAAGPHYPAPSSKDFSPALFNSFIALVKDTSLAANITIPEMFLTTQRITARNYEPLLMYIEVGFIYLIFCTVLNYLQKKVEDRLMLTPHEQKRKIKEITDSQG